MVWRAPAVLSTVIVADNSQATEVPEELRPLVETATFVVSSWFCSIIDPFCIRMRNEKGARWVKITYFRDLDLPKTPQARFPSISSARSFVRRRICSRRVRISI